MRDSPERPSAAPNAPRRRTPWFGSLALILLPALALVLALAGGGWALAQSSLGLRAAEKGLSWLLPSLKTEGLKGSLREGFTAERLAIDEPGWSLVAEGVVVRTGRFDIRERLLDLAEVSAREATVRWAAGDDTKSEPPESIRLPLKVILQKASIGKLHFGERGQELTTVRDVSLRAAATPEQLLIEHAGATYGDSRAVVAGRMGMARPFPLVVGGEITSQVLEQPLHAALELNGSLLDARFVVKSDTAGGRARVAGQLQPYAPVPLGALSVDVSGFDPSRWFKDAPVMRLTATAELKPQQTAAGLSVAGPFKVENALPGLIDQQKVPLQSARGELTWTPESLRLSLDRAVGAGGTAQGIVQWRPQGPLTFDGSFSGMNGARIHSKLVETQAKGDIKYRQQGATQRFEGSVVNTKGIQLGADFKAALANQTLAIERLVARLGKGRAQVSGTIELAGRTAAKLRGEFEQLDLSQLVAGLDTRLDGRFEVDGHLEPQPSGSLQLALRDSRLYGRPLQGRANVRVDGQLIDLEADLRSGKAHLTAEGGLGKGRTLEFKLDAPQLAELAPDLRGSVTASGTIGGTVESPIVQAKASANDLLLPNRQRVEAVEAAVQFNAEPSAPLDVRVQLKGYYVPDRPELSLAKATLTAEGITAAHTIELDGVTATGAPLSLEARGGLKEMRWVGTILSAAVGAPFNFRLEQTAEVAVAMDRVEVGPLAFTARDTNFSDVRLALADDGWRTSGEFSHLQPQVFDPRARAPRRAVRTTAGTPVPLTLAGRWDLQYDEALNGIAVIERTAGDFYGGIDAVNPIGVSDIGAALSIVNNRVTGTAYLRGRALGEVDAVIDAYVNPNQLALAENRPFRIAVDAELPDLGWMGPLISDTVQIQGAASINAVVGGKPADPTADGTIRGRDLRVAWIEHGLRLENGMLNASLTDGVLVIDEAMFTGVPRTLPTEKRALASVSYDTPGTLRLVGRIALETLTGSIGFKADKLPILQRNDRFMAVSGEGGITLTPTRAELYAKTEVDGAYIDFSTLSGPRTLPDDVVVVRTSQSKKRKEEAPPVDVVVDVETRLGPRFYIRGAGLEARLAGGVEVTGRPGQLQAEGIVRIVDGAYNSYGQRLQIRRGLVTFQGPLENPALNVLAIRTGLPVEVGVQIGGTALNPVIRLYSDVAMPDVEKLNWLVLGRPLGGGEGQERALLTAAATALFSGQSDGTSANVLRSLGIDEFGIRSGQTGTSVLPRESVAGALRSGGTASAAGDFVAVGKRISDDLSVTIEQALSGTAFYVALNYQLSRRLSVIARAGSTTALDLVYSIAFD